MAGSDYGIGSQLIEKTQAILTQYQIAFEPTRKSYRLLFTRNNGQSSPQAFSLAPLSARSLGKSGRVSLVDIQGVRSQGVETSGVERSSCDARVWVLPKRQNKMADIILDRQRDYPAKVSHYPVAFICCKQQRRNKLFFLTFVFCFVQFFPREQISVLNIVPPP